MANYKLIEDVPKRDLLSAYVKAPFDEGKIFLESRGYRIISLEENAKLRMQEGHKSDVSQNGNWVLEDVIHVPNKGVFLTKNSPIMDNAEKASEEYRNGRDFYLTKYQVEKCLENSVELNSDSIPTNRFKEFEITRYAFGESAEDYGKFLKGYGINRISIWLADIQDKPFAKKLWFGGLGYNPSLSCDDRNLFSGSKVHVIKENKTN